jgi:cell division protein ZapA
MGNVVVEIGGRSYPLSCRDGDEAHLTELAAGIAQKADGLTQSLGPMSEARLLLMAALMVADELHDVRRGKVPAWLAPAPAGDSAVTERLSALLERAERLATTLQE